jgi:hypothetical protein
MPLSALRKLFLLLLLLVFSQQVLAQKTDIVILTNGDKLTGEIKKLEAGLLQYSTDAMGTVSIEWRFIETIITNKQQTIETNDGTRWLGKIQKPAEGENVQIVTAMGPIEVAPKDVVSVWPVEATFLDKMSLSVSAGLDYAKSTDIRTMTLASDFLYRTEERIIDASLRSNVTRQGEGEDQNRQEVRFNVQRLLLNRRYRSFNSGYDRNEAIGLNLRLFSGGSYGRYLIKSNRTWFSGYVGLIGTWEKTVQGEQTENIEAVLGSSYRYFSYARPERTFDTSINIFPSLTDSGRVRGDLRSTFKLELVSDLFWSMEFYATYDNEPVDEGAETSDYGINTGLGWSF